MRNVLIVIPCYNEVRRIPESEVMAMVANDRIRVLLVDDGSADGTRALIEGWAARAGDRVHVLAFDRNGGKAEAVRRGMLWAIDRSDVTVTGYLDADFATPAEEAIRLVAELDATQASVVMGARVARSGAQIDRDFSRHVLGRVFATVASFGLGLDIYDTQCGAKLFRVTPALRASLKDPFTSRWSFDVELLGRLIDAGYGSSDILEVPLRVWRDVDGSTLNVSAMAKAGLDLLGIAGKRVAKRARDGR